MATSNRMASIRAVKIAATAALEERDDSERRSMAGSMERSLTPKLILNRKSSTPLAMNRTRELSARIPKKTLPPFKFSFFQASPPQIGQPIKKVEILKKIEKYSADTPGCKEKENYTKAGQVLGHEIKILAQNQKILGSARGIGIKLKVNRADSIEGSETHKSIELSSIGGRHLHQSQIGEGPSQNNSFFSSDIESLRSAFREPKISSRKSILKKGPEIRALSFINSAINQNSDRKRVSFSKNQKCLLFTPGLPEGDKIENL